MSVDAGRQGDVPLIVVVDRNPINAVLLASLLETLGQCRTGVAKSLPEASFDWFPCSAGLTWGALFYAMVVAGRGASAGSTYDFARRQSFLTNRSNSLKPQRPPELTKELLTQIENCIHAAVESPGRVGALIAAEDYSPPSVRR